MAMTGLLLQFSTSPAFASGIIRRLTHSDWSHVDLMLPGEGLLGVSGPGKYTVNGRAVNDKGGVQIRPFQPWPYKGPAKVAQLLIDEATTRAIVDAGRSQIDKPFDNKALYSFLRDRAGIGSNKEVRDWRHTDSWFCSEFATWACEEGGLFRYQLAVSKEAISPNDLLLLINPYMSPESIRTFIR
jgi:hypothetical protein